MIRRNLKSRKADKEDVIGIANATTVLRGDGGRCPIVAGSEYVMTADDLKRNAGFFDVKSPPAKPKKEDKDDGTSETIR